MEKDPYTFQYFLDDARDAGLMIACLPLTCLWLIVGVASARGQAGLLDGDIPEFFQSPASKRREIREFKQRQKEAAQHLEKEGDAKTYTSYMKEKYGPSVHSE